MRRCKPASTNPAILRKKTFSISSFCSSLSHCFTISRLLLAQFLHQKNVSPFLHKSPCVLKKQFLNYNRCPLPLFFSVSLLTLFTLPFHFSRLHSSSSHLLVFSIHLTRPCNISTTALTLPRCGYFFSLAQVLWCPGGSFSLLSRQTFPASLPNPQNHLKQNHFVAAINLTFFYISVNLKDK